MKNIGRIFISSLLAFVLITASALVPLSEAQAAEVKKESSASVSANAQEVKTETTESGEVSENDIEEAVEDTAVSENEVTLGEISDEAKRAITDKTQAEAVAWIRSMVGKGWDADGAYGVQCVDLVNIYYYDYFGLGMASGHAYEYKYNALPDPNNLTRIQRYDGFSVQPGDIVIWDSNAYLMNHSGWWEKADWTGHVGLAVTSGSSRFDYVDFNHTGNNDLGRLNSDSQGTYSGDVPYIWGVIRPNFKKDTPPVPEPEKGSVMQSGYGEVVPNGYYQIVSMLDSNYALDIQGYDSFGDAPNAQLFRNRDVDQDVFELTYNGKFYTIRHVLSGKYLDVEGSSQYNGANVLAYTKNNGADNQQWAIKHVGDSIFQIEAKISGYRLDVTDGLIDDRINIQVCKHNDTNAQRWRLVPWSYSGQQISNGNYHIVSWMYDQKYGLNVDGTSGNFRNVGAAQNLTNGSQVFTVEYNTNNNVYTIKQKGTKYWLEIENAGKTRNIGVAIGDANGNPDGNWKRWYIKNTKSSGWYGIINRETGDSVYYNNRNGSNVVPTYGNLIYEDQWWKFVRAVDSVSISKTSATVKMGSNLTLTATVNPSAAANKTVTWTSSNKNVAAVNSSGVITPKSVGTTNITVKTADGGYTATCKVTVVIPPTITKTEIKEGHVDEAYSDTVTASGTEPITWSYGDSYTENAMKNNGLTLDTKTGTISGTPKSSGNYGYYIKATNPYGEDLKDIKIRIAPKEYDTGIPVFLTETLPDATVGEYYKAEILMQNGRDIVHLNISDGQRPRGIGCNVYAPGEGTEKHFIEGTPMIAGVYEFTVSGENSFGKAEKNYTLKVNKNLNGADAMCGDNATFKLYDDGTLVISGTGELYGGARQLWYDRKDKIKHIVIQKGITSITDDNTYGISIFRDLDKLEDIILPEGLTNIPSRTFQGCNSLKEVTVPSGVKYIGHSVFQDSGLQVVRIPKSVINIGSAAFYRTKLTDVYYEGSESEWNQISINGDNKEALDNAIIHFNSKIEQPAPKESYTVKFMSAGEVYKTISIYSGETAQKPSDPIRENYRFDGWYTNQKYESLYNFNTKVTQNIVVYAKWIKETPEEVNGRYIVAGQKINLSETCFANVEDTISRYIVDNKKLASVSKTMLTGSKPGTVKVTAQMLVGKNTYEDVAECNITILNKPKLKFGVPMTYDRQVVFASNFFTTEDTNILGATYWESSNPKVVEVTDDAVGMLEAHGSGSAKITAYFGEKNKPGTLKVSASIAVKIPSFSKKEYKLQTGAKTTISMKNVNAALNPEWATEDTNIATAIPQTNKKGPTGKVIINGLNAGSTRLIATIDGQDYYCDILVAAPKINKAAVKLYVGKSTTVSLKNTRLKKEEVDWQSSDSDVARVDAGGKITALRVGEAIIYTETGGVRNECVVTVK